MYNDPRQTPAYTSIYKGLVHIYILVNLYTPRYTRILTDARTHMISGEGNGYTYNIDLFVRTTQSTLKRINNNYFLVFHDLDKRFLSV